MFQKVSTLDGKDDDEYKNYMVMIPELIESHPIECLDVNIPINKVDILYTHSGRYG